MRKSALGLILMLMISIPQISYSGQNSLPSDFMNDLRTTLDVYSTIERALTIQDLANLDYFIHMLTKPKVKNKLGVKEKSQVDKIKNKMDKAKRLLTKEQREKLSETASLSIRMFEQKWSESGY